MVYDAARGRTVIFGGYDGTYLGDTWEWGSSPTRDGGSLILGMGPSGEGCIEWHDGLPSAPTLVGRWVGLSRASYATLCGETRPACGDIDGDGRDEIVLGMVRKLGQQPRSRGGWLAIFGDSSASYNFLRWHRLPWTPYNWTGGETRPSCGDLDDDGRAEVVVGVSSYPSSGGWFAILDDANASHALLSWERVPWSAYYGNNGETRPACTDVDGDDRPEVAVGLGTYPSDGGWIALFGNASSSYALRKWLRLPSDVYNAANGETRVAGGRTEGASPQLVVGRGPDPGGGWVFVFEDPLAERQRGRWFRTGWRRYNLLNGETWPALCR